jgi:hypothetical protein
MAETAFRPTHRHRKGGEYELLGYGRHTETEEETAVYRDVWGRLWVRPRSMFDDGRFTPLSGLAPTPEVLRRMPGP